MMQNLWENGRKLTAAASLYSPSAYRGFKERALWSKIKTFCLFLGYPRSGHSSVGALLNAHPDMVISHESEALKYCYLGFGKRQIYDLIYQKTIDDAETQRVLGGYSYHVPDQWQGKVRTLKTIGDKQGEGTVLRIAASDRYITRLKRVTGAELRFIHVVRNPYDNISTMMKKTPRFGGDLNRCIEHYFYLCRVILDFKATIEPTDLVEFKHEDFLNEPQVYLKELCDHLNVEATQSYLDDCSNIVYKVPNKSRYQTDWSPEQIDLVAEQIARFPFLSGYAYDS